MYCTYSILNIIFKIKAENILISLLSQPKFALHAKEFFVVMR